MVKGSCGTHGAQNGGSGTGSKLQRNTLVDIRGEHWQYTVEGRLPR